MVNWKHVMIGGGFAIAVFLGSLAPVGPLLVGDADARVGRPLTPVSYAGVARRTTRRVVRRSTIYVATLPPSCTTVNIDGTVLQQCGATYYQPYQGQYVVVYVE